MDAKTWAFLRSYILDYVVGVLWLIVMGALFLTLARIKAFIAIAKDISGYAAPLSLTDFAAGVLTVVTSIMLPYCLAILLMPVSQIATNIFFLIQNLVWRRNLEDDARLEREATQTLQPGANSSRSLSDRAKIMLLHSREASVADDLSGHLSELGFRADVLQPASLLLFAISKQLGATVALAGTLAGSVFLICTAVINANAATWRRRLNVAVIALNPENSPVEIDDRVLFRDAAGGMWLRG